MNEYLFTFRSVTQAQTGQRLLQRMDIPSQLRRTPKMVASQGCGFSLAVRGQWLLLRAAAALQQRNVSYSRIYRLKEDDTLEEVLL